MLSHFLLNSIKSNSKVLNISFGAISVVFILWTITIWVTLPGLPAMDERSKRSQRDYKTIQVPPSSAFNTMVERNLFSPYRENRGLTIAKAVKVETAPKRVEPVQQKTPPPKLNLIGTILIGNSKKAILSSEASGLKTASYKVGDDVEGFILKTINAERITLEKDGEILEVALKGSAVSGPAPPPTPTLNSDIPPKFEATRSKTTRTLIPVKMSGISIPPPAQ